VGPRAASDGSGAVGRKTLSISPRYRSPARELISNSPKVRYCFAVALARWRRALMRFGQLVVRPYACLRVHAPIVIVTSRGHRQVILAGDELPLPTQSRAKVRILKIEANPLFHSYPVTLASGSSPAACKMHLSTAARAIGILYPFCPRLFAGLTAAWAAAAAIAGVRL